MVFDAGMSGDMNGEMVKKDSSGKSCCNCCHHFHSDGKVNWCYNKKGTEVLALSQNGWVCWFNRAFVSSDDTCDNWKATKGQKEPV